MSQNNNSLVGSLDYFNLLEYPLSRYFFKLNNIPVVNSISLFFDGYNNRIISEYKIVCIVRTDEEEETIDNIEYIKYNSEEAKKYAKSLINTTIVTNRTRIKITEDNYLNYIDNLIGCTYVDFSLSEKIKSILLDVDEFGKRLCTNFTVSYFYSI